MTASAVLAYSACAAAALLAVALAASVPPRQERFDESVTAHVCDNLTENASSALRQICEKRCDLWGGPGGDGGAPGGDGGAPGGDGGAPGGDGGAPGDPPEGLKDLELKGVRACVVGCGVAGTCGKATAACGVIVASQTSSRCRIAVGVEPVETGVFVAASPFCPRKLEGAPALPGGGLGIKLAGNEQALLMLMTFPERLVFDGEPGRTVEVPGSFSARVPGFGSASCVKEAVVSFSNLLGADPVPGDTRLPLVSVYRSSVMPGEQRPPPTDLGDLARRLHEASARVGEESALLARQPKHLTFTITCSAPLGGEATVTLALLGGSQAQPGGQITDSGAAPAPLTLETVKWHMRAPAPGAGAGATSPLSQKTIGQGASVWLCLTVDTWTGDIVEAREVIHGAGESHVTRTLMPGMRLNLSAELPVRASGVAQVSLGYGRAAEHFLGR